MFFPLIHMKVALAYPNLNGMLESLRPVRARQTGRPFNLAVAFERKQDEYGNDLGRAVAQSSFHHFVDYNWDIDCGSPGFVAEPPGNGIRREPNKLEHIKRYVRNVAFWLAPCNLKHEKSLSGRDYDMNMKRHANRVVVPVTCEDCGREGTVALEQDEWLKALDDGEFAFGCPGCFRNEPIKIDPERRDMIVPPARGFRH